MPWLLVSVLVLQTLPNAVIFTFWCFLLRMLLFLVAFKYNAKALSCVPKYREAATYFNREDA